MKIKIYSALLMITFLLVACSDKKNTVSTNDNHISPDIINNPSTASGEKQNESLPVFDFTETTFDFGTINSGDDVTHEFKFKNSGNADLVISEAKGSCGCTVPEYPKQPVKPGDDAVIKVTFHSSGIAGQVAKTITILANTIPNTKVLTISAEVIKK